MLSNYVPPGFVLLFRVAPKILGVGAATYGALHFARQHLENLPIPTGVWFDVTAYIAVQILVAVSKNIYYEYSVDRDAAAMGAERPPKMPATSSDIVRRLTGSNNGYIGDIFRDFVVSHGNTLRFSVFGDERMFTVEPAHIKAILATQFNDFHKGPVIGETFDSMLGVGVFNSDGEMWKFHRSMTRPYFNRDRISDFDTFDAHADDIIKQMKARLEAGYAVDFQDAVARFTLDSATEFLFGKDVGSQAAGLPYPDALKHKNPSSFINHPSNRFVDAFFTGQELIAKRSRSGGIWRLREFFKDVVIPQRRSMEELIIPIVQDAIVQKKTLDSSEKEHLTFLQNLVEHTEDVKVLTDELINMLVAGRDTTSSTTAFAVYVLTQRPDIVSKLRAELLEKVGPSRRPSYDDIRDMKYLRAFINEVLRLYPVVPFNSRTAAVPTTLPNPGRKPYYVQPGTRVLYSVLMMHRRTDLWGPDAETFDPDRFIDERLNKYLLPNPFIFLPFNAGPRICLGQQFAYNEISFFLIRLLQNFGSFELASDVQPEDSKPPKEWASEPGLKGRDKIRLVSSLTMSVKGGLWLRMTPVKGEE